MLIEAGPRLLPTFPEELGQVARTSLERMGVQVLTSMRVTECGAAAVVCGHEKIVAGTIVWAAGVVASPAGAWIEAESDRAGRIRVGSDLTVPGQPQIFAVGDLAAVQDATGRAVPGNAPAAKQMGRHVGRVLAARAAGASEPGPFTYRHHGDLATIGRRSAVVTLDSIRLTGLIGWWFWGIAHVWYLIGFRSRVVVSFEWLWSYLTFQRGARQADHRTRTTLRQRGQRTRAGDGGQAEQSTQLCTQGVGDRRSKPSCSGHGHGQQVVRSFYV